jgi:diaminopimelate decarboxylase
MLELHDGHYTIGGIDALTLCEKYDTPVYVYDTAVMEKQYKKLKGSFKGFEPKIKFACKALNNINILRFFHGLGAGLDCVSIQEVWVGLKAGFKPSCIPQIVSPWKR